MKRTIAVALWLFLSLGNAWSTVTTPPQEVVKNTYQRMIEALNKNREILRQDPGKIYGLVNEILLPNFDFDLMARWVLGKYWREATPEQRSHFTEEFRTLLVRTYAGALLEYSDEKIDFPAAPALPTSDDVTVRTEVRAKEGKPIPIDYRMHLISGAWKVYDVSVDGVSLVTNYRGAFASQIREGGIESVISGLKERNQQFGR